MKVRWRAEEDEWSSEGAKITEAATLDLVRRTFEDEGPIIVEHRWYRGASAPDYKIFEQFEEFERYLNEECFAGDSIWIWSHWRVARDANALVHGKCPDDEGMIPRRGAY